MEEESFSLKEYMEKSLARMDIGVKDLKFSMDKNNDMTEKVLIQATKTNGRVTAIEEWASEAQKVIQNNLKDIGTFKEDKAKIQGGYKVIILVAIIIPTLCTTIFGLYVKSLNSDIDKRIQTATEAERLQSRQDTKQAIVEALLDNVDKIEYAK